MLTNSPAAMRAVLSGTARKQLACANAARSPDPCQLTGATSGGVSPKQKIPLAPGYQVPLAQAIKQATAVTTMAVGLITEAKQAEEIVASGKADMVALARGMLYDPRWGWHAAAELGGQVEVPPQYWRSQPSTHKELFGKTTFGAR